ncbi:MAG: HAD family hydrolase [Bacteroidetes bacterium]|nr:HAD family hydrolase [Bacteroidota bacterium]
MIQAITIDFWNTTVDSRNGARRRQSRNLAMETAYRSVGKPFDEHAVAAAFEHSYQTFEKHWYGEQRTMGAAESLQVIWDYLGLDVSEKTHADTVRRMEDSILEGMPALLPGCSEALEALAAHAPLALISDTALSPGRVLRRVLEAHGVDRHFSAMIFSDETGVSKPHPRMFERALDAVGASPEHAVHIGDIERTDIAGAKAMGMRAILFRGDESGRYHEENHPDQTFADAVAHSWSEVCSILESWGLK